MDRWKNVSSITQRTLEAFEDALEDPGAVQHRILQEIIAQGRGTDFGIAHNFESIHSYELFRKNVPLRRYEDFADCIHKIAEGQPRVLTRQPVLHFEETGGSSAGPKMIPYTQETLNAFQRGVLPWLGDLLRLRPVIMSGKVFFFISPALRQNKVTASGLPFGTGDDLMYFGEELGAALSRVVVTASDLYAPQDVETWKRRISLALLQADDLSLMSLWSPTLFLELIRFMQQNKSDLLLTLSDRVRIRRLDSAISPEFFKGHEVWPLLDTISCWTHHTSTVYAEELQTFFPGVFIQGKGLLSTEAITSIPYSKSSFPILAVGSHFFEFVDSSGEVLLFRDVDVGESYSVVVTTQSGLYRYDTGDKVLIRGKYKGVPLMEFTGREGMNSDLCGEKLSEAFVTLAIRKVSEGLVGQCILIPVKGGIPHYQLIVADKSMVFSDEKLLAAMDNALCENPQYAYARRMGQLKSLTLKRVEDFELFLKPYLLSRASRLSTIKIASLWTGDVV